jgi:prolyl-tRNA synthetase
MRYTRAFIPTVKEAPKDATMPSHVLLLRGGFVRMVGAGIYEMLPLGLRVMNKIAAIVREELNRAGAHELLLPAILPKEYFEESGRWESFGPTLLRLKDRKGGEYHLGPTHEEIITDLVRREVRSYRQMPLNLYQVQMKYRDEPRPRAGLLRCREFLMKDAYSFDVSEEAALKSYEGMRDAYHRIFSRLGLEYRVVSADSGAMGGSTSAEFQVLAQNGEDAIVACSNCAYAANVEVAETVVPDAAKDHSHSLLARELVHTPRVKTIDEVVSFLGAGLRPEGMLKSLLYLAGDQVVMAVVRGDHEVNEVKLARALGVEEVFMASEADIARATGAAPGFAGPVGFAGKMIVDADVTHVLNAVTGANQTDHHFRNVTFGRDFQGEVLSIRAVRAGDECPKCGEKLQLYRGIEGGHIFVLGTHYSAKMNATFLDEEGNTKPVVMGCYGIGVSRLVATAVEQNYDDNGIRWPMAIAPYHVMLTPIGKEDEPGDVAAKLHEALEAKGVEVLLDDRDERPGVKFKDADLLGIPLRVTIGKRGLSEGKLELKARTAEKPEMIDLEGAAETIAAAVRAAGGIR